METKMALKRAKRAAVSLSNSLNRSLPTYVGVSVCHSKISGIKYNLCVYLTDIKDKGYVPDQFEGYKIIVEEMVQPRLATM